jgi:hypothetical protein
MNIQFNASKFEFQLIRKIRDRALAMAREHGVEYDSRDCLMDIEACHCNGTPLDLNRLLAAPDVDFAHDVFGIRRHINRRTGVIGDCFLPRCAMPEKVGGS